MKGTIFIVVLQLVSFPLAAQFSDDFSDADLASHWQGDLDKFTVTDGELQLSDQDPSSTNTSYLYALAPTSTAAVTTWRFRARCDFAPSTGNFATVFLATDQPPGGGDWVGYFLKIGGITGTGDALELYRQDAAGPTLLLSGTSGAVANDPVDVSVLIERTTDGIWTLEADYFGGDDYDTEGSVTDATYPTGNYFGFAARYTSTRNEAFFFDDVLVEPTVTDDTPPLAEEIITESPEIIVVRYAEPLALNSTETPANYVLDNGVGAAQSIGFADGDRTRLRLEFANPLTNLTTYVLTMTDVEDLAGNVNPQQTLTFDFLLPEPPLPGDLVITEIFPDPTPPVGLPNFEYIELYNRSDKVIQLGGLGFSTGSTPREIEPFVLPPQGYVILTDEDGADAFSAFGEVAAVSSFPALTNGGDDVILLAADGSTLIDFTYDDSWYRDPIRAEGGYALELIDTALPNDCPGNWRASMDLTGGTPGAENSVFGTVLETEPPALVTAFAPAPNVIVVRFDDVLDAGLDLMGLFDISPALTITTATLEPDRHSVRLTPASPLLENTVYTIRALSGLRDCIGNVTTNATEVQVGLAETPRPGDLVINEILFNPNTGGVDFVELYNPTDRILAMQGVTLRNEAITSGTVSATVTDNVILLPGEYLVFTENPGNILMEYPVPNPAALIENDLPSLGDAEGNLSVYNPDFEQLDALDYTEDWHSRLLSDRDGVSLERLRADAPTQNEGNWASAASTVGYATPTGRNSQDRTSVVPPAETFFVLPESTFSPDEDGFQDVLEIRYSTDRAGLLARILIFDAQGRLVRRLDNLELLAGTGGFLWDGTTDDETRARIGIYVLVAEIFSPEGDTFTEKMTAVLAGRLD